MSAKSLSYFMRDTKDKIVTVPGPDTFKDESGKVIDLEIRMLSQAEVNKINEGYRRKSIATDKRGNPVVFNGEVVWKTERDNAKAMNHIIVEALAYPNLKDKELMSFYQCVDVTDMPMLVFSSAKEYNHVLRAVMTALGMREQDDESELEEAKN